MNPPFPGITEGRDHLNLRSHIFVFIIRQIEFVCIRHKVGGKLNAIGRVHVDTLHLPGQSLMLEQSVHHQEGITRNHAIRPLHGVIVRINLLRTQITPIKLRLLKHLLLDVALPVIGKGGLKNTPRVHSLMLMDGEGRHLLHIFALVEPL